MVYFRKVNATPNCLVYTARSVQDFLDCLDPTANHWRSAKLGDLAYRGQANSNWPLAPKAFRRDQLVGYGSNPISGGLSRVVPQARAEFRAVQQFVKAADTSGLQVVGTTGRMLLDYPPRQIFNDPDWEYGWPQDEILETIALAQHHGVPTRLLDFTDNPLVAAFFAACSAWDPDRGRRIRGTGRYISVWIVDMRFIRGLNGIGGSYRERIGEVRVPRANNFYLHAQSGFFLVDRGANDVITRGGPPPIDAVIAARAQFWHTGRRLRGRTIRIPQTWFDQLPVRQVRLETTPYVAELLGELSDRRVTTGSLMPSLDRVVESLEFQRSIP